MPEYAPDHIQNVLTVECMLGCWRRFIDEMIKRKRRERMVHQDLMCLFRAEQ